MKVIESDNIVWVDVDDTLVCWDISNFPEDKQIEIYHVHGPVKVVPHQKNINTMIKFYKLGYEVFVHSGSGWKWAQTVIETLGLTDYVTLVTSKCRWYIDDKPIESWAGGRVWRDPITGKEG